MTCSERRVLYQELKKLEDEINELKDRKNAATEAGQLAFREWEARDLDVAYAKADEAGWDLADQLDEQIAAKTSRIVEVSSVVWNYKFDFGEYESTGAYGQSVKKSVRVTFLDGSDRIGLIYPYVYDNPQEYYLATDGGDINLDEGWEVEKIEIMMGNNS